MSGQTSDAKGDKIEKTMKFYYFKNGKGNVLAKKLLGDYGDYEYQNPVQAIFFGKCTISDLKARKEYLFDLDRGYRKHLRDDGVSVELKKPFEDNGYVLSSKAKISKIDEKCWEIRVRKIRYEIKDNNKKLNIYRDIDQQAIDFYKWSKNELGDDVYSVIVSDGKYWITKPTGFINDKELGKEFKKRTDYRIKNDKNNEDAVKDDDIVKIAEVEIVSEGFLKDVPTILSNIGANLNLVQGTFREIKEGNIGNLLALDEIMRKKGIDSKREYDKKPLTALRCLGANELETLIAKIFEESGLFVPSYVGGFMKDIDLFVYNDNEKPVKVGDIEFEGNTGKTVQIKSYLGHNNTKVPEPVDIYFQLNGKYKPINSHKFRLNCEWIEQVLPKLNTRNWLKRLLHWIPKDLLELL
jgi:hypothetical protein